MRIFTVASLLVATALTGCTAKAAEEKLTLAAGIFARYNFGWFNIDYFDTKIDAQNTMHFTDKETGKSFSVREDGECNFVFKWNTEITDSTQLSDFASTISVINFSKLHMKDAQFFKSQMEGAGILEISGVEGAVTHLRRSGPGRYENELRMSSIPMAEKDLYLNRVKTMQEKFCEGLS